RDQAVSDYPPARYVARGLALLFGLGTKALPSWDSKTRWNNLLGDLGFDPAQISSACQISGRQRHQRERFEMKFHSFCLARLDYLPNEALFGYAQRVTTGDVPGFATKSK